MTLPRKKKHKRKKLLSATVAGAPLLSLLLSGCPDREVTEISTTAGTEYPGGEIISSNPKGSMYDIGILDEQDQGGEIVFSNPKGSMYDEGVAGAESDIGSTDEADFGEVVETGMGSADEADMASVEADSGTEEE
jgi:hypothetical protein